MRQANTPEIKVPKWYKILALGGLPTSAVGLYLMTDLAMTLLVAGGLACLLGFAVWAATEFEFVD